MTVLRDKLLEFTDASALRRLLKDYGWECVRMDGGDEVYGHAGCHTGIRVREDVGRYRCVETALWRLSTHHGDPEELVMLRFLARSLVEGAVDVACAYGELLALTGILVSWEEAVEIQN